jgi:hypothetical protein
LPHADGDGVVLTTLHSHDRIGDEGVYFANRLLPIRLPMDETTRVWPAERAKGELTDALDGSSASVPRGILPDCARRLSGLPVLFVGVRCPIGVVMERRRATWGVGNADDGSEPEPVRLWQHAVHVPGIYDLEVDTSVLSPEACADVIRQRLDDGPPPSAFQRLEAMATG